jgi:hypothetical protein
MLSYHTLKDKPRVLRALTTLDPEEFETLLIPFEQVWEAYVTHHVRHKQARKRRYGGGRKPHLLAIEDKLLFILFYFKLIIRVNGVGSSSLLEELLNARKGHLATSTTPGYDAESR